MPIPLSLMEKIQLFPLRSAEMWICGGLSPGIVNGRLQENEGVVDNIEEWNLREWPRAGFHTRIGHQITNQSLHQRDRPDRPAYPVLGFFN
jgi:hypothetical protein